MAKYFVTVLGCCRHTLQTEAAVGMGSTQVPGKGKAIFRKLDHNLQLLMLTQIFLWFHVSSTLLFCRGIISASGCLSREGLNWNSTMLTILYQEKVI